MQCFLQILKKWDGVFSKFIFSERPVEFMKSTFIYFWCNFSFNFVCVGSGHDFVWVNDIFTVGWKDPLNFLDSMGRLQKTKWEGCRR